MLLEPFFFGFLLNFESSFSSFLTAFFLLLSEFPESLRLYSLILVTLLLSSCIYIRAEPHSSIAAARQLLSSYIRDALVPQGCFISVSNPPS